MKESATVNTPLPPSMEKAYHQKCIELKRRLKEIEASNDAARLRRRRIDRAIEKMRLERAFLYERLAKIQGFVDEASDRETSPPPTPQERPSRRPRTLATTGRGDSFAPDTNNYPASSPPGPPGPGLAGSDFPSRPNFEPGAMRDGPPIDRRAPSQIPSGERLPEIAWLPSHTNVIMVNGEPKQPPWTIRDIAPRHHLRPDFDALSREEQEHLVVRQGYLPYDIHGNPVLTKFGAGFGGKAVHIFRDDPQWQDVIVDSIRTDDPFLSRFTNSEPPATPAAAPPAAAAPATAERQSSSREGGGFTAMNK